MAITDSTSLLTSAALENASQSEQYELELNIDATEAPLPSPIDPTEGQYVPTLSDEQVKDLLLQMSRAGKSKELKAKLAKLGVGLFSSLKGDARQAFVDWLVDLAERS